MGYISTTIQNIINSHVSISNFIFVLPSKRAGFFLKREILNQINTTQFAPIVITIEELVQNISDLKIGTTQELIFELYQSYLSIDSISEKDSFENFYTWATTLLNDFDEIDRNLIDASSFFSHLKEIKDIEHWSLSNPPTEFIQNYLSFWSSLSELHDHFCNTLKNKGIAHQGLVYREAAENVSYYLQANQNPHVFIGFNALNAAESVIFQELLENEGNEVYWDADTFFMENDYHNAGLFLREVRTTWKRYKTKPFQLIEHNFSNPKEINIVQCTNSIAQLGYVSAILESIPKEEHEETAVVLADESLLIPLLYALPESIERVNISLGMPLQLAPLSSLFESFFKLHKANSSMYYYKEVFSVLSDPFFINCAPLSCNTIQKAVIDENITYLSYEQLLEWVDLKEKIFFELIFKPLSNDINLFIDRAKQFLLESKEFADHNPITAQAMYKLYQVLNFLESLNTSYGVINSISSLFTLYKQIAHTSKIDFKGEPFIGLQIMGLLETRALDFKNVIVVSLNEGVLPAGKSNNSFITFDLKLKHQLPTYQEKDAVYAYHFYRLIHRAQNIHLLYENSTSGLHSGQKSRFITQLNFDRLKNHTINEYVYNPQIKIPEKKLQQIEKTPLVIKKIEELLISGLSPSAVNTYIRNPIEFYEKYILKIKSTDQVEDVVEANTLGNIVHKTLELLYTPYLNTKITPNIIEVLIKQINKTVEDVFAEMYKKGKFDTGKNKLIFETAKRFVYNFLKAEKKQVENSETSLFVISLEDKVQKSIKLSNLNIKVTLKGSIDRVDVLNNQIRIIDYKTGNVTTSELNLQSWDNLFTDYNKNSKKVQVLFYALLYKNILAQSSQVGVISFKNLSSGFMPFTDKIIELEENTIITKHTLQQFENQLELFIEELLNPEIPFIENEILKYDF